MMNYKMEELLPIIKVLSEKYTSKESTSISWDTANQLMGAVIYCINEFERSKKRTSLIQVISAHMAYEYGYELVVEKTKKAMKIYEKIMEHFHCYENRCYYDTIVKGMPQFFLHYDAKFRPQDRVLMLDYPTPVPIHKLQGIDCIYEYLKYIWKEQRLLSQYTEEEVCDKLYLYTPDFPDMIENIYEIFKNYKNYSSL